jgi:hypothetical protein
VACPWGMAPESASARGWTAAWQARFCGLVASRAGARSPGRGRRRRHSRRCYEGRCQRGRPRVAAARAGGGPPARLAWFPLGPDGGLRRLPRRVVAGPRLGQIPQSVAARALGSDPAQARSAPAGRWLGLALPFAAARTLDPGLAQARQARAAGCWLGRAPALAAAGVLGPGLAVTKSAGSGDEPHPPWAAAAAGVRVLGVTLARRAARECRCLGLTPLPGSWGQPGTGGSRGAVL